MSGDFGLKAPKAPWVCPNDRQLALRAKLKTGWSIKTNQFSSYPKPAPISEKEHQAIVAVIKRAEELELYEQQRVGKLVDRLESLKRLSSGTGVKDCVLCGDTFGLAVFGRTSYKCNDCKKAVCRKCVVDIERTATLGIGSSAPPPGSPVKRDSIIRLCKLCSEQREFFKKSGAWFYKGVPTYILPPKRNHYHQHYSATSLERPNQRPSPGAPEEASTSVPLGNQTSSSKTNSAKSPQGTPTQNNGQSSTSTPPIPTPGLFWSKGLSHRDGPDSIDSSSGDEAPPRALKRTPSAQRPHTRFFQTLNPTVTPPLDPPTPSTKVEGSPITKNSLTPTPTPSPSTSNEGSSPSGQSSSPAPPPTGTSETIPDPEPPAPHGLIDLSLLYDESNQALHCSIHKAKGLKPMDKWGLSDPYCLLTLSPQTQEGTSLRTKTVHRSTEPVFNESLTFHGLPLSNDLQERSLHIKIMDEDTWGKECLGWVQIPLHRLRSRQTRFFQLPLDKPPTYNTTQETTGDRGRLLLSLCYQTNKQTLIVGVIRAENLPAFDRNGTSDPFVKLRLLEEGLEKGSGKVVSRKYKTRTVWRSLNPEFKEEFPFKVPLPDLANLALALSVWDKDIGKHNDYIGGVLLSSNSKGDRLSHWRNMLKGENRPEMRWHPLSSAPIPR